LGVTITSIEDARGILQKRKNIPIDEDYIHVILTFVLEIRANLGRNLVEVRLRPESFDRINSAPTAACLAIDALMAGQTPSRKKAYLTFREDGRTVEVKFLHV